jgi:hypothetical protein
MEGQTVLGVLTVTDVDQPFILCSFQPTEEFEHHRSLFEERLRLVENEDWSAFEAVDEQIRRLGLVLKRMNDGAEIDEFLLHVRGKEAWFRPLGQITS